MPINFPLVHSLQSPSGRVYELLLVEGGDFIMGGKPIRWEKTVREVKVSNFYIGRFPVTQDLWEEMMGENPSRFIGPRRPVEMVSWNDVQIFIQKLVQLTEENYRLPSEAEWEYAARGGQRSESYIYSGSDELEEVGWFDKVGEGETEEVGLGYPNELGLYDMSSNVCEWCEDQWHDDWEGAPETGSAWVDLEGQDIYRVYRGGSWNYKGRMCRSIDRLGWEPDKRFSGLGFRIALSCL